MSTLDKVLERLKSTVAAKLEPKKVAAPTYPARNAMPVEKARERVASDFRHWLQVADEWWQRQTAKDDDANAFEEFGAECTRSALRQALARRRSAPGRSPRTGRRAALPAILGRWPRAPMATSGRRIA